MGDNGIRRRRTGSRSLIYTGIMYFVYAIQSEKNGKIYVGFSSNLQRRLFEHNHGYVFSTKGYRPWCLIYKEQIINRKEARIKEKYFKSGIGKEYLKSISPVAQR